MSTYLTQQELAVRWQISERTLEGWRSRQNNGPGWARIGRSVRYPLAAVEAFEHENLCTIVDYRNRRDAA